MEECDDNLDIRFIKEPNNDLEEVKHLFREYSNGLKENLCFQHFDEELEDPFKKYGEPKGCLLIVYKDNKPAGCIALQPLQEEGVCEMKRLYVKQEYRGCGIGDKMIQILLEVARKKGYTKMLLDTLERLEPAMRLYKRHGFKTTTAYYQNPLTGVVYMERDLQ